MTDGGRVDSGRGRMGLVGEGEGGCAEAVRKDRSPPSSLSNSLPLVGRNPSPNGRASGLTETGLTISLAALLTLDPVGCGDIALAAKVLLDLELPICSKIDRREDTGFCRSC